MNLLIIFTYILTGTSEVGKRATKVKNKSSRGKFQRIFG